MEPASDGPAVDGEGGAEHRRDAPRPAAVGPALGDDEPRRDASRRPAALRAICAASRTLPIQRPDRLLEVDELGLELDHQRRSSRRVPGEDVDRRRAHRRSRTSPREPPSSPEGTRRAAPSPRASPSAGHRAADRDRRRSPGLEQQPQSASLAARSRSVRTLGRASRSPRSTRRDRRPATRRRAPPGPPVASASDPDDADRPADPAKSIHAEASCNRHSSRGLPALAGPGRTSTIEQDVLCDNPPGRLWTPTPPAVDKRPRDVDGTGRAWTERAARAHLAVAQDVVVRTTIATLDVVVFGLTLPVQSRTVRRSPHRRTTLGTGETRSKDLPPRRHRELTRQETSERTDPQLRVTPPSRDRGEPRPPAQAPRLVRSRARGNGGERRTWPRLARWSP